MNRKFGIYVFIAMLIGALFGAGLGSANGLPIPSVGIGALVGVFVGWFIAAAILGQEVGNKEK